MATVTTDLSKGRFFLMSKTLETRVPLWKRILFSPVILEKSDAHKIAYIGVMTALCIAANFSEIKFATTQFSLTMFITILTGMIIGPLPGAATAFLADGIGYIASGMRYPYYWWVALSVAVMAIIGGLIIRLPLRFRGSIYVKLSIICVLTFLVCSLAINSTGMFYLGFKIYIDKGVLAKANELFGGNLTFGIYLLIRFFILGQIWNSVVNYVLLFAALPILKSIKYLKLDLN